jgi:hypothetical protein
LCKYGCTDDLPRRSGENRKIFKKEFDDAEVELLCFSIIDARYIFEAETSVRHFFEKDKIEYENNVGKKYKELVIINRAALSQIKQHFGMIQTSYIGRYEEMNNKVVALEKQIMELNHTIILNREKHRNELKDKDIELKNKDIEILQCKLQYFQGMVAAAAAPTSCAP